MLLSIGIEYFRWHFGSMLGSILRAWKAILRFGLDYFSLPLLLKTLFAPWRRYAWAYPRGFQPALFLEALVSNFISRVLGAFVRLGLVITGICAEALLVIGGIAAFILWLILPFLIIWSFFYGILLIA